MTVLTMKLFPAILLLDLLISSSATEQGVQQSFVNEIATTVAEDSNKAGDELAKKWELNESLDEKSVNNFLDDISDKTLNKTEPTIKQLTRTLESKDYRVNLEDSQVYNLTKKIVTSYEKELALRRAQDLTSGGKFNGNIKFSSETDENGLLEKLSKKLADESRKSYQPVPEKDQSKSVDNSLTLIDKDIKSLVTLAAKRDQKGSNSGVATRSLGNGAHSVQGESSYQAAKKITRQILNTVTYKTTRFFTTLSGKTGSISKVTSVDVPDDKAPNTEALISHLGGGSVGTIQSFDKEGSSNYGGFNLKQQGVSLIGSNGKTGGNVYTKPYEFDNNVEDIRNFDTSTSQHQSFYKKEHSASSSSQQGISTGGYNTKDAPYIHPNVYLDKSHGGSERNDKYDIITSGLYGNPMHPTGGHSFSNSGTVNNPSNKFGIFGTSLVDSSSSSQHESSNIIQGGLGSTSGGSLFDSPSVGSSPMDGMFVGKHFYGGVVGGSLHENTGSSTGTSSSSRPGVVNSPNTILFVSSGNGLYDTPSSNKNERSSSASSSSSKYGSVSSHFQGNPGSSSFSTVGTGNNPSSSAFSNSGHGLISSLSSDQTQSSSASSSSSKYGSVSSHLQGNPGSSSFSTVGTGNNPSSSAFSNSGHGLISSLSSNQTQSSSASSSSSKYGSDSSHFQGNPGSSSFSTVGTGNNPSSSAFSNSGHGLMGSLSSDQTQSSSASSSSSKYGSVSSHFQGNPGSSSFSTVGTGNNPSSSAFLNIGHGLMGILSSNQTQSSSASSSSSKYGSVSSHFQGNPGSSSFSTVGTGKIPSSSAFSNSGHGLMDSFSSNQHQSSSASSSSSKYGSVSSHFQGNPGSSSFSTVGTGNNPSSSAFSNSGHGLMDNFSSNHHQSSSASSSSSKFGSVSSTFQGHPGSSSFSTLGAGSNPTFGSNGNELLVFSPSSNYQSPNSYPYLTSSNSNHGGTLGGLGIFSGSSSFPNLGTGSNPTGSNNGNGQFGVSSNYQSYSSDQYGNSKYSTSSSNKYGGSHSLIDTQVKDSFSNPIESYKPSSNFNGNSLYGSNFRGTNK